MTGKYIKILLLIVFFQVVCNKYVFGNNSFSIIEKTFNNIQNIYDNNLNTFAAGDLKNSEQQIVVNLKDKRYINEINIVWGKIGFPFNLRILGSTDYVNWKLLKVLKLIRINLK